MQLLDRREIVWHFCNWCPIDVGQAAKGGKLRVCLKPCGPAPQHQSLIQLQLHSKSDSHKTIKAGKTASNHIGFAQHVTWNDTQKEAHVKKQAQICLKSPSLTFSQARQTVALYKMASCVLGCM